MGKCQFSRKSQCFEFKSSQVKCCGGFWWWGIVCEHYFSCLGGSGSRNFVFFRFFRYKNVTFIRKVNFLTIKCQNSDTLGVFIGGESIPSIIFHAWVDSGPKNLECNVIVDPQSHKIHLLRGQTHIGWTQLIKIILKIVTGTLSYHFKIKIMGLGRNGGLLDLLSRFVTPTGALFPQNFFQRV